MFELISKANKIRKKGGYTEILVQAHHKYFPSVLNKPGVKEVLSSYRVQKIIEKLIFTLEYLQGIGSGWDVKTSGESSLINLFSNINKHKIIIDTGAHKGEFTDLVLSNLSNVTIHQFEPQQLCIDVLEKKYKDNDNVIINEFALSNTEGQSQIYYTEEGTGGASLTERKLKHNDATIEGNEQVKIDTLETYINNSDIDNIDLLKIDVEGNELDVLRGGENLFKNEKVKVCSFEFGGCCIDTRTFLVDYFDFFEKHGYHLYRLTPGGYLYPLPKYREIDERFRTTVYVAISNSAKSTFV